MVSHATKRRKKMLKSFIVLLLFAVTIVTGFAEYDSKFNKHFVDMNPKLPRDSKTKTLDLEAEIGQFLELTCPQYDTATPVQDMSLYYVYEFKNDKKSFDNCILKDKMTILSCDSPYQTTKLTLKFQKKSPYPLGFTFKTGRVYYYIAIPKDETDCTNAIKLKVDVKKKGIVMPSLQPITKEKNKSTTTTTTTRPKTTTTTTITTLKSTLMSKVINHGAQTGDKGDGGNGASSNRNVMILTMLLALVTLWLNV